MGIDWRACDERLHAGSVSAIRRLAAEARGEPICFFAFDTEPRYGYVLIAFDTLANNVRQAKAMEAFAIEQRGGICPPRMHGGLLSTCSVPRSCPRSARTVGALPS